MWVHFWSQKWGARNRYCTTRKTHSNHIHTCKNTRNTQIHTNPIKFEWLSSLSWSAVPPSPSPVHSLLSPALFPLSLPSPLTFLSSLHSLALSPFYPPSLSPLSFLLPLSGGVVLWSFFSQPPSLRVRPLRNCPGIRVASLTLGPFPPGRFPLKS